VFSTEWAGVICVFHECSHYGNDKVFNIHGLWPDREQGYP